MEPRSADDRTARQTRASGALWPRLVGAILAVVPLAVVVAWAGPRLSGWPAGKTAVAAEPRRGAAVVAGPTVVAARRDHAAVELIDTCGRRKLVYPCQAQGLPDTGCSAGDCGPAATCGTSCAVPWEVFAQGEYIGPVRDVDVPVYWLRVGDELEFIYRVTREERNQPYELNVGDRIRVESVNDATLDRELVVQPDGMITLRMLGQVRAARRTVAQLREDLEQQYAQYYKVPAITVTPVQMNTQLEDLRAAIDSCGGQGGGQTQRTRVAPDGTIQLPAIGSVPAQGLALDELKLEIDERYAQVVDGISVTPRLLQRAARYVYVLGEVRQPGRYTLEAPTTAMQAIALAGGWNSGGKLRQIVVFRRTEDWRLIATKLDLRSPLLGKCACPADEIWLRDSDIVLVPKSHLLRSDELIELIFARGIYGLLPGRAVLVDFRRLSSL